MPIARLRDLEKWFYSFQQNPPMAFVVLLLFIGLTWLFFMIKSHFQKRGK